MSLLRQKTGGSPEEQLNTKLLAWPDSYYHERDPEIRRKLLDKACETLGETEADVIRKQLYDRRYVQKDGRYIDRYLGVYMDLRFLAENGRGLFAGKRAGQLEKKLDEIGFDGLEDGDGDSLWRGLLYSELVHMAMLYIELCTEDSSYGAMLFGLGRMSEKSLHEKITADIRKTSTELFRLYHPPERYGLWKDALEDALADAF